MAAEVTTVTVTVGESTILTVGATDVTVLTYSNEQATVIQSASATANLPVYVNLSDAIPAELSNTGSAGTSLLAARADHSHPLTGATFNGGNF